MSINSQLSSDGRSLTIGVVGSFDFELVQDFRSAYAGRKNINYIIDMRSTEYMDSSALGMLLNMRKTLGDGVNISIVNCRPQIKKILTISCFDKKFKIG
jgi:anti-anti-sigma factor